MDIVHKTHRRDQLIEWIKGLLVVPFVLLSQPQAIWDGDGTHREGGIHSIEETSMKARARYVAIMADVEDFINDYRVHQAAGTQNQSRLKQLVPTVGPFFTSLPLRDAVVWQDQRRRFSSRRFVGPSFNDIRLILNTAQLMSLVKQGGPELLTFDGDVTLYDDGKSLTPDNPAVPRLLSIMRQGIKVGIVTAAGYTKSTFYYQRLHGILDAIASSDLPAHLKKNFIILGGESSYLFQFDDTKEDRLVQIPRENWELEAMRNWTDLDISILLDLAETALRTCISGMHLQADILRKERAVGIVPRQGFKLSREQLEETVLVCQKILELSPIGRRLPFCAFNGGNDVFIDIGDKSWGVACCQRYFGGITGDKSLHVGDQFLSVGANDFKARMSSCTAWIASPAETVALLDELAEQQERLLQFQRARAADMTRAAEAAGMMARYALQEPYWMHETYALQESQPDTRDAQRIRRSNSPSPSSSNTTELPRFDNTMTVEQLLEAGFVKMEVPE